MTLIAEKHMSCQFMVRVRSDDDQLLAESGDANLFVPDARPLRPQHRSPDTLRGAWTLPSHERAFAFSSL